MSQRDWQLTAARKIAYVMDDLKLDPWLGFLLPGIGDAAGGIVALSLIALAVRRRVGRLTIARMLVNVAIDAAVGVVPIFGDLFDVWFAANSRNAYLLERATLHPEQRFYDGAVLLFASIVCVAALCLPVVAAVWLIRYVGAQQGA